MAPPGGRSFRLVGTSRPWLFRSNDGGDQDGEKGGDVVVVATCLVLLGVVQYAQIARRSWQARWEEVDLLEYRTLVLIEVFDSGMRA